MNKFACACPFHLFTTRVPWVWHSEATDPPMKTYWKLRSFLSAFQLHSLMFSRHILYLTDFLTLSGRLTRRMRRSLIWPQNHKTVLHLSQNLFININNTNTLTERLGDWWNINIILNNYIYLKLLEGRMLECVERYLDSCAKVNCKLYS